MSQDRPPGTSLEASWDVPWEITWKVIGRVLVLAWDISGMYSHPFLDFPVTFIGCLCIFGVMDRKASFMITSVMLPEKPALRRVWGSISALKRVFTFGFVLLERLTQGRFTGVYWHPNKPVPNSSVESFR